MIEIKEPIFYNCCVACGVGSGQNTKEGIKKQIEKYGEFICETCERNFNTFLETEGEVRVSSMGGTAETLITEDNIYHFESDRGKVLNPSSPFLGFAGRWFLIIKDYKDLLIPKRKIMLTNNLFHHCRIPKSFQEKFKKAGKVNATVTNVSLAELKEFKKLINEIPYIE